MGSPVAGNAVTYILTSTTDEAQSPGVCRPIKAKVRLRSSARDFSSLVCALSFSFTGDLGLVRFSFGSRSEAPKRTQVREAPNDDEPDEKAKPRLHCSALRERPSSSICVLARYAVPPR